MKKKKPCGSLKWMATTKMNNETINSASIFACSWRDSIIYFMSTLHRSDKTTIIQHQSEASKIDVQTPIITEQYCKFMRNVNITNQLCVSYTICQKTKRWYLCLFY
jgi:uncharacterized protein YdeI (YjbR/CyaY-like superfamily)